MTAEQNAKKEHGPKSLKLEESFEKAVKFELTCNDPPRKKKRPSAEQVIAAFIASAEHLHIDKSNQG